jgi:hypothetical protein
MKGETKMAKITSKPTVQLAVTIELNEDEAGALDALFGYDVEVFLEVFYKTMGLSYLQPYEKGLRSLHKSRGFLSDLLSRAQDARRVFEEGGK